MLSRRALIVAVDDDPDMNRALQSVLGAAGFEAAMFSTGAALLEHGLPSTTTCLVLDVHLPDMNGFALYDRLSETHAVRPVIFISAFDEPETRARAERANALAFLTKPFPGKKLIEIINNINRPAANGESS